MGEFYFDLNAMKFRAYSPPIPFLPNMIVTHMIGQGRSVFETMNTDHCHF